MSSISNARYKDEITVLITSDCFLAFLLPFANHFLVSLVSSCSAPYSSSSVLSFFLYFLHVFIYERCLTEYLLMLF